jgi:hypothetical protein
MNTNFTDNKEKTAYQTSSTSMGIQSSVRELFTYETGQVLEVIGKMFVNIPPFNDHIDQNTGRLLISIGKKLKKK